MLAVATSEGVDWPAWIGAVTAVISVALAIWAAVSAARANAAKGKADLSAEEAVKSQVKAAEAATRSANAQTQIAAWLADQTASGEPDQARRIVVEESGVEFEGRRSFVVRNRSQAPIHDLEIEPLNVDASIIRCVVLVRNGVEGQIVRSRVEGPMKVSILSKDDATNMWQLSGRDETRDIAEQVRLTFDDANRRTWERIGNQEPVRIQK
jgi:hypothetical protein